MTPEHWKRVGELFEAAVEQEPAARAAFLARMAASDAVLAEEVLRLLASDENAGAFLNTPPGLGSLPVSDEHFSSSLELLREENPSLASDLQTLLREGRLSGDGLPGAERAVPTPAAMIGQQVGAYTLESAIGQGGMGTVWVARRSDGRFEGRAAVKFLNLGLLGSAGEERFKREGSILARLAHPNIAHLIDAGVAANGQPYLILEYVEGNPIDAYCNGRALDVEARIRLFLDVLAAVAHAHASLIVHRDIKPSNVLVTRGGRVKLLDFGIAKLLEDEAATASATKLTREGERALTLAYASPEQVTGNAVTTGTDVYALGVLLYLLLTGKHPAQSALQSPVNLIKAIVDTEPPRPSDITETSDRRKRVLRGDLDTIIAKALKKNPQERYASVTAFSDDLRRYLGYQTISARPDTLAYRARKFVRRNRLAVALALATSVATGAGFVGTVIQSHRAARAAERARLEAKSATAIKDFLLGIFKSSSKRQPNPMRAQAVTARELLDRGVEGLLADATLDSPVALELLSTMGDLYSDLSLYEKAREIRRKQVELARAALPPNDPRLASALASYAVAVNGTAQAKDSLALLEEAQRILDANGDQTSLIRANVDMVLAIFWQNSGRDIGRALSHATKAVEICRRYHPDDLLFVYALEQAAINQRMTNHPEAAIQLSKEAVDVHRRLGAPALALIKPLIRVAEEESSLSRFADSERDFKEALALSLQLHGENEVDTIETQRRYGESLRLLGRLHESEAMLRKAAETAVRLLGPEESSFVPWARSSLAKTLVSIGKLEEADSLYRQALATTEKARPNTINHANLLERVALLQSTMGRYELADQLLVQWQSIKKQIRAEDPERDALLRARHQLSVGKPSLALSTLGTTTFKGGYALFSSTWADVIRASALLDLGRPEEAERVVSVGLDRLGATPEGQALAADRADLFLSRGLALTRLGRAKEAARPLQDALAWREANLDENSPLLAESLIALAECHLAQGERTQAESLIERAQRIHRAHPNLGEHLRSPLRRVEKQLSAR